MTMNYIQINPMSITQKSMEHPLLFEQHNYAVKLQYSTFCNQQKHRS